MKNLKKNSTILSIYGIQDICDESYPVSSHDHSIALFESGRITKYCQLERITQIKYDNKLHFYIDNLTKYMLLDFNILSNKITEIQGGIYADQTSRIQVITDREENLFMF